MALPPKKFQTHSTQVQALTNINHKTTSHTLSEKMNCTKHAEKLEFSFNILQEQNQNMKQTFATTKCSDTLNQRKRSFAFLHKTCHHRLQYLMTLNITVMDCIRDLELEQMSYKFGFCETCKERRLEMKMASATLCSRCSRDNSVVPMFSAANNMDPGEVPVQLANLTIIEQQLICRLSPAIQVHMLKHGGIAANGHCVTFPQNVNEPSQILPKLPSEINLIRVRKQGKNQSTSDFNVRRYVVQHALLWLKENNPAYSDISISQSRLEKLPDNGPIEVPTVVTASSTTVNDAGPAPEQCDSGQVDGDTVSGVNLPDPPINIREEVEKVVQEVIGPNHGPVTSNRKTVTIPWPTRNNAPLSEFTTKYFFSLAFPCLFPYGTGDFHINRPRTCASMSDWAEHLIWYKDGRFAQHQYFKFIAHNIIMRKRTLEQSSFIVKQQLGDNPLSLEEIKHKLEQGDMTIGQNKNFCTLGLAYVVLLSTGHSVRKNFAP